MNREEVINSLDKIQELLKREKYEEAMEQINTLKFNLQISNNPEGDYIDKLVKDLK